MAKQLDVDKMLQDVEKGKGPKTLAGESKFIRGYTQPSPEPPQTPPPAPKSYAPRGMGNQVTGDIGQYRQIETMKVFSRPIKKAGKPISNPLSYRRPEMGIDAKFGPGDKVC